MEYIDREMLGILVEKLEGKECKEWVMSEWVDGHTYDPVKEYKTFLPLTLGKERTVFRASVMEKSKKKTLLTEREYSLVLYTEGVHSSTVTTHLCYDGRDAKRLFKRVGSLIERGKQEAEERAKNEEIAKKQDFFNKLKWALKEG